MTDPQARMGAIDLTRNGALFSECERHRHLLWRVWSRRQLLLSGRDFTSGAPVDLYIGLNPSKAGSDHDDPTVRKWRGFSQRRGGRGFIAANLYDLIATDQRELWRTPTPLRTHRDWKRFLQSALGLATGNVVVCWGAVPNASLVPARIAEVLAMVRASGREPLCFGLTRGGHPKHPSRLPYNTPLVPY